MDTQEHALHPEIIHTGHFGKRRRQSCRANHRSPTGHPARGRCYSRQVSWLAGQNIRLAFPRHRASVTLPNECSPLTVAGAAPAWQASYLPTGFPS